MSKILREHSFRSDSRVSRLMARCASYACEVLEVRRLLSAAPVGTEIAVTDWGGDYPAVAASKPDGVWVVAFAYDETPADSNVWVRPSNGSGTSLGSGVRVNSFTTSHQDKPSVAIAPSGDFVVVWESLDQDGSSFGVYGQRFSPTGSRLGDEFRVNASTSGAQVDAKVACDQLGNFVVTWGDFAPSHRNIYLRAYTRGGVALTGEIAVAPIGSVDAAYYEPAIAMNDAGEFVIVYEALSSPFIRARQFSSTAIPVGPELLIGALDDFHSKASVGIDAHANFVVAWNDDSPGGNQVLARRFVGGIATSAPFEVAGLQAPFSNGPDVAKSPDGPEVIGIGRAGSQMDIRARSYNASGIPVGSDYLINTYTSGAQEQASIAMSTRGDFIAAWYDRDRNNLRAQRMDNTCPTLTLPPTYNYLFAPHRITLQFDEFVGNSLSLADISMLNLDTGQAIPPGSLQLSFNQTTNVATVSYLPNGGVLPDADYRLTLLGQGITDGVGHFFDGNGDGFGGDNYSFDFFFLRGDANHDRRVNLTDFNILAANFGLSNRNFSQGDFNYDNIVNLADFNILAGRFGQTLGTASVDAARQSTVGANLVFALDRGWETEGEHEVRPYQTTMHHATGLVRVADQIGLFSEGEIG